VIDFRYHLVSIVSIFLALAVGIVLGAGPLKEDLGTTLTQEVTKLRQDKAALRTELDAANKAAEARDAFAAAGNPRLLADRLGGRTVALVVLPGVDSALVKSTSTSLTEAGATIGATITVSDAWVDPSADKRAERTTLGDQLIESMKLEAPTAGQAIDSVLAAATVEAPAGGSGAAGAAGGTSAEEAAAALEQLRKADLVSVNPDGASRATSAVVIAAPVTKGEAAEQKSRAEGLVDLAAALDSGGSGVVLASNTGAAVVQGESVITTARRDATVAKALSTVDDAGMPMGQASVVVALEEQYAGTSGHYGLASDASEPFAPLAATR
jgi:hypothetical protein